MYVQVTGVQTCALPIYAEKKKADSDAIAEKARLEVLRK
jgi:hypothetical protein